MNNPYETVHQETIHHPNRVNNNNGNRNFGRRKQKCRQALALGQLLSLCLAVSGALGSSLEYQCNISIPTLQEALIYLSLAIVMFPCLPSIQQQTVHSSIANDGRHDSTTSTIAMMMVETNDNTILMTTNQLQSPRHFIFGKPIYGSLRFYFLMAFLDVEANYFIILAYRYTTLTSISILDALAIPSAMICSILILRRRYKYIHVIGVLVSILGMTINVMHDYETDSDNEYADDDETPFPVKGDVLAILGSILYGLNDTLTERIVKIRNGTQEYLAMLGIIAFGICCVQTLILEQDSIKMLIYHQDDITCSTTQSTLLFLASAVFGFLSYYGMSQFLIQSEAALLYLSLLTGDLWAALFVVEAQSIALSVQFWIALILITMGVIIYEFPSWSSHETLEEETDEDIAMTEL
jgi:solute carrier family 35 protein F1/2